MVVSEKRSTTLCYVDLDGNKVTAPEECASRGSLLDEDGDRNGVVVEWRRMFWRHLGPCPEGLGIVIMKRLNQEEAEEGGSRGAV